MTLLSIILFSVALLSSEDIQQIKAVLNKQLKPLHEEISQVKIELQKGIQEVKADMKVIKSDIAEIRKNADIMLGFFDRMYAELRQRLERIEEHLNLLSYFA